MMMILLRDHHPQTKHILLPIAIIYLTHLLGYISLHAFVFLRFVI